MFVLLSVLGVVIPKSRRALACAPQNMVHAADLMMTSRKKMDGGDHVGLPPPGTT